MSSTSPSVSLPLRWSCFNTILTDDPILIFDRVLPFILNASKFGLHFQISGIIRFIWLVEHSLCLFSLMLYPAALIASMILSAIVFSRLARQGGLEYTSLSSLP